MKADYGMVGQKAKYFKEGWVSNQRVYSASVSGR